MTRLRLLGRGFFLVALVAFSARVVIGQDAAKVAADTYKVTSENKYVRVLDVHIKAGAKVPMHSHPGYVAVAVTDCKVRFTGPDGKSQVADFKAGDAMWREAESHSTENIGVNECHAMNIEVKAAAHKSASAAKTKTK